MTLHRRNDWLRETLGDILQIAALLGLVGVAVGLLYGALASDVAMKVTGELGGALGGAVGLLVGIAMALPRPSGVRLELIVALFLILNFAVLVAIALLALRLDATARQAPNDRAPGSYANTYESIVDVLHKTEQGGANQGPERSG